VLIRGELEYNVPPTTIDRYCSVHNTHCVSDIAIVFVEINSLGVLEGWAGNKEHSYNFPHEWSMPGVLIPRWLELFFEEGHGV